MVRSCNLIVLALAILSALALTAPGNVEAKLYMSVSGKVIDAVSSQGLQGVTVVLMSSTKGKIAETKSDSAGIFLIANITSGDYDVIADPSDQYHLAAQAPIPVVVLAGKNVVGVSIKLQQGGAVRGRVVTQTGSPVPNADIVGDAGAKTTTDLGGYFVLSGMPSGTTGLTVVPTALGVKKISVTCERGRTTDLGNIVLSIGVETAVQGAVTDTAGKPISGAILVARGSNATGGYTVSSSSGSFVIAGLSAGMYDLSVVAYGYDAPPTQVTVPSTGSRIVMWPIAGVNPQASRPQLDADAENTLLSKFMSLFINEADAASCKSCPNGFWGSAYADLTGIIRPASYTVAIANYFCFSSSAQMHVKTKCWAVGAGPEFLGGGVSLGVGGCSQTCCGEDLLTTSNGWVGSISLGFFDGKGGPLTFSGGNTCVYISPFSKSGSLPDWEKMGVTFLKKLSYSITYQFCETEEFNIFDWLCSVGYCL